MEAPSTIYRMIFIDENRLLNVTQRCDRHLQTPQHALMKDNRMKLCTNSYYNTHEKINFKLFSFFSSYTSEHSNLWYMEIVHLGIRRPSSVGDFLKLHNKKSPLKVFVENRVSGSFYLLINIYYNFVLYFLFYNLSSSIKH